jgi:hypothetical protein
LLEAPAKIGLGRADYLTVQQIYRGWALLGFVALGELISTVGFAWTCRGTGWAGPALGALACVVGAGLEMQRESEVWQEEKSTPGGAAVSAPERGIEVRAAIEIRAPRERVRAVYLDVAHWWRTFPRTIESARVVGETDGVQEILVNHKAEGLVPNRLTVTDGYRVWLEERKRRYDAVFLNEFEAIEDGAATRYVVTADINLKGIYRALRLILSGYVRRRALRQITEYVLEPLRAAAERPDEARTGTT